MRTVKRISLLLIELAAEGLLLGCLLGFLVSSQTGLLYGVIGSALAVPVVLFLHGYYLTRCLAGVVLRSLRPWFYASIATVIFVAHTHFAVATSKSDLTPFAQSTELPFLARGACIVFACAFVGDRLLRKWIRTTGKAPSVLLTDVSANITSQSSATIGTYSYHSTEYLFTGKERDTESGLDYFGARYFGSALGRFSSPDWSEQPDTVPYAEFEYPQTLNLYSYARNNPLTYNDPDGHDVNVCLNDGNGNQHCTQMTNEQYAAASQGNGGTNVPTLNQVGMNGDGNGNFNATNITDSNGSAIGTSTYVSNGGADYYANRNGFNLLATTAATVGSPKGIAAFYGASALVGAGLAFSPAIGRASLTTLGTIPVGLQPGAVVGGFVLTTHAVEQAAARGVTLKR